MHMPSTLLAAAVAALLAWAGAAFQSNRPSEEAETMTATTLPAAASAADAVNAAPVHVLAATTVRPFAVEVHDGRRDFDFLHGTYRVHNRRLKERLAGSTEWEEFEAINRAWPILDGLGNQDLFRTDRWPNFLGMSFRFFDPETQRWAIHWADNRRGVLEPPVYGAFVGDTGLFFGDDVFEGRPIRVRFTWTRGQDRARWEQAFSADGGKTWETNWTMDFRR